MTPVTKGLPSALRRAPEAVLRSVRENHPERAIQVTSRLKRQEVGSRLAHEIAQSGGALGHAPNFGGRGEPISFFLDGYPIGAERIRHRYGPQVRRAALDRLDELNRPVRSARQAKGRARSAVSKLSGYGDDTHSWSRVGYVDNPNYGKVLRPATKGFLGMGKRPAMTDNFRQNAIWEKRENATRRVVGYERDAAGTNVPYKGPYARFAAGGKTTPAVAKSGSGEDIDVESRRYFSPISVTRRRGIPYPIPSPGIQTNAYHGSRHVGYIDSQSTVFRPKDDHMINVYVDRDYRGQGVARKMTHAHLEEARRRGKTSSASGHRSEHGDRLATRMGHAPARRTSRRVEENMDDMWALRRRDREVEKSRDWQLLGVDSRIPASRQQSDPISPLAMYASSRIMLDNAAALMGRKMSRRERKRKAKNLESFVGARGLVYTPLGMIG